MQSSNSTAAALGKPLVRAIQDPCGEKGVVVVATQDILAGEALLVETPLLATPKPTSKYMKRLRCFAQHVRNNGALSEAEGEFAELLALRWMPVLRAYAQAPLETRERVVALQTEFADPNGRNACSVRHLSRHVYGAKLFDAGQNDYGIDDIRAVGHTLSEAEIEAVVSSMMINAADTLPDGSEALFYVGALLEHSCAPNTKFCVYTSGGAAPERGVAHLPASSWVGEWRTLCAIREGEAATTSYLEDALLVQSCEERQRMLYRRMGFHCRCKRCLDEGNSAKVSDVAHVVGSSSSAIILSDLD